MDEQYTWWRRWWGYHSLFKWDTHAARSRSLYLEYFAYKGLSGTCYDSYFTNAGDLLLAAFNRSPFGNEISSSCTLPLYLQRIHSLQSVKAQSKYYEELSSAYSQPSNDFERLGLISIARLDKDQRVYDSIKSLCIFRTSVGYISHADVFEPPKFISDRDFLGNKTVDLLLLLILLKVKLLLDLMRLDETRKTLTIKLPQEPLDMIIPDIPRSPVVATNQDIVKSTDLSAQLMKLETQVDFLYTKIHKKNKYFWMYLASHHPNGTITEVPTIEEIRTLDRWWAKTLFIRHAHCWFETPGAISLIAQKVQHQL